VKSAEVGADVARMVNPRMEEVRGVTVVLWSGPTRKVGLVRRAGRYLQVGLAAGIGCVITACGTSDPTPGGIRVLRATNPAAARASCPERLSPRSDGGSPSALAPKEPTLTSFCLYARRQLWVRRAYAGDALAAAVNQSVAKLPPDFVCTDVARAPAVVVVQAKGSVRRIALSMGGCPTVILSDGKEGYLLGAAGDVVLEAYQQTVGH
jgi:hypothetical protein